MQLAGEPCSLCQQKVLLDSDGTWCARCFTIFHRECIVRVDSACSACHKAYEPPERQFAYSRFCPECMKPNEPVGACCVSCGARTCWDSVADYQRFVAPMRETSFWNWLRGWAEVGLALVCLGAFILIVTLSSYGPVFVLPGACLLAMFILIGDGFVRLRYSRAIQRFA
jgi:hypothetical protein